ncbi:MAG TPA: MmgE/PrpD family protein [Chloroflexota bacterium]|nr:MmgE/PrpD family protein [Chloroflexota bacterium]
MSTPTRDLTDFVVNLRFEDIPEGVLERAKDIVLDAIGCAIAGHEGDETSQVEPVARALGGPGECTVIAGSTLSPVGATLLNAYLITAVTVCDVHRPTLCHIAPEVLPPALAIAEQRPTNGRDLLKALVVGMESATRVGLAMDYPAFRRRGWHSPGVIGPFGGAAAVGSLLGLDADRQLMAFGLAGSQSAGTFAAWGTPTVKFHQARAAVSGLLAGLLAEQGFRASEEILTHPDGGLLKTYADGGRPAELTADLGKRWELENISLRLWPTASSIQAVITAVLALVEQHDLSPANVTRVRVGLSAGVYQMHGEIGWEGKFRALLSTKYVVAVVLADRQCWLDQFTPERIADPAVNAFASGQVTIEIDPSVEGTGAVVEMTDTAGRTYVDRRAVPRGDTADPLSRREIEQKFRLATRGRLSEAGTDRVIDLFSNLEQVASVSELCQSLRAPAGVLA